MRASRARVAESASVRAARVLALNEPHAVDGAAVARVKKNESKTNDALVRSSPRPRPSTAAAAGSRAEGGSQRTDPGYRTTAPAAKSGLRGQHRVSPGAPSNTTTSLKKRPSSEAIAAPTFGRKGAKESVLTQKAGSTTAAATPRAKKGPPSPAFLRAHVHFHDRFHGQLDDVPPAPTLSPAPVKDLNERDRYVQCVYMYALTSSLALSFVHLARGAVSPIATNSGCTRAARQTIGHPTMSMAASFFCRARQQLHEHPCSHLAADCFPFPCLDLM